MEEMNFNTQHDFKDIVSVDNFSKFFFFILNSEARMRRKTSLFIHASKSSVIYDVLMVFKVDLIMIVISSNK